MTTPELSDAIQRAEQWLARLEQERTFVVDKLHDALGNFGTTHEHIEGLLDGLDSAMFSAKAQLHEAATQDKGAKRALARLARLEALLDGVFKSSA